ncbi:MAG: PilZ domain-containing protein [Acidobacteriota bacterium]|nr:PilZ domain-containing protein [Acidobacteriota bacterium]
MKLRIITLGSDDLLLAALEALVGKTSVDIIRAPSAEAALEMRRTFDIGFLVLLLPLGEMSYDEFTQCLSESDCSVGTPRLLVLGSEEEIACVSEQDSPNVTTLSTDQPLSVLRRQLSRLLRGSPRLNERFMVRLEVGEDSLRLAQAVDLSETGMLVVTNKPLPIGTILTVEFNVREDHESIRVKAEVVRLAKSPQDEFDGCGLRFTAFERNGDERLRGYIALRLKESSSV